MAESPVCGYTWPDDCERIDSPSPAQQSSCVREPVPDADRCAWHVSPDDTAYKTAERLRDARGSHAARPTDGRPTELLDGADLSGVVFTDASLAGVALRGATATEADLQRAALNGAWLNDADLREASLNRADLRGADLTGADLTGSDCALVDLSDARLSDSVLTDASLREADLNGATLKEANLAGVSLASADFVGADLTDANLTKTDLTDAILTDANARRADFTDSVLSACDLSDANLSGSDLSNTDLRATVFTDARLSEASLLDANLREADLSGALLRSSNLTDASVQSADLTDANITATDFTNADLTDAEFTDASLQQADLTDANLTGASLRDADLTDADLTGASLRDADLTGVSLRDADLTDAGLTNALLRDATLTNADLTTTTVEHTDFAGANLNGTQLDTLEGLDTAAFGNPATAVDDPALAPETCREIHRAFLRNGMPREAAKRRFDVKALRAQLRQFEFSEITVVGRSIEYPSLNSITSYPRLLFAWVFTQVVGRFYLIGGLLVASALGFTLLYLTAAEQTTEGYRHPLVAGDNTLFELSAELFAFSLATLIKGGFEGIRLVFGGVLTLDPLQSVGGQIGRGLGVPLIEPSAPFSATITAEIFVGGVFFGFFALYAFRRVGLYRSADTAELDRTTFLSWLFGD